MRVPPQYQDEFDFFQAAVSDGLAAAAYRRWIEEVAGEEVEKVMARESLDPSLRPTLILAAMQMFERAFERYARREHTAPVAYPFSDYFRWWARQGALQRARSPERDAGN